MPEQLFEIARRTFDTPEFRGYEVVLDVLPDVEQHDARRAFCRRPARAELRGRELRDTRHGVATSSSEDERLRSLRVDQR